MHWQLMETIQRMEHEGYGPEQILATVRSRVESDCRAEDAHHTAAERAACAAEGWRHLALTVASNELPF